ncbi:MAG: hypothetical protein FWG10_14725 [Eubacteriaceae bacterium]|nr:hypothetical protein [Eubacteriaceae bacterium]
MKYGAITIGPVFDTISQARSVSELWTASYLYSWFSQQLVAKLQAEKAVMIAPKAIENVDTKSVGCYSDRLYFELGSWNGNQKEFEKIVLRIKHDLAVVIISTLHMPRGFEACKKYLDKAIYAKMAVVEQKDFNLSQLNKILNTYETGYDFVSIESRDESDFIEQFLNRSILWRCKFIVEANMQKVQRIDSIASKAREIPYDKGDLTEDGAEEEFVSVDSPRIAKYYAIVYADGDGLGTYLENLNQSDYEKTSEELIKTSGECAQSVRDFGGQPIYFGGDDMFFIAPVYNKEQNKHLLAFLGELRTIFHNMSKINQSNNNNKKYSIRRNKTRHQSQLKFTCATDSDRLLRWRRRTTSLSFGVSIAYYKYPMSQVIEDARGMLFGVAKEAEWTTGKKNTIALQLRKNSGSTIKFALSPELLETVCLLLNCFLNQDALHSLHWKILTQFDLLFELLYSFDCKIMGNSFEAANERLELWFKNNFNEAVHKERLGTVKK